MPQVIHEKSKAAARRRVIVPVVLGLIVLVGLAVVIVFSVVMGPYLAKQNYNRVSAQAIDLVAANKGAQAVDVLQKYLDKRPPAPYKGQAEMLLGTADMNSGAYQDALRAYKQAEKDGQKDTQPMVHSIAESARLAGDRATAMMYYKKELEILKARHDEAHQLDVFAIERQVAELEAAK